MHYDPKHRRMLSQWDVVAFVELEQSPPEPPPPVMMPLVALVVIALSQTRCFVFGGRRCVLIFGLGPGATLLDRPMKHEIPIRVLALPGTWYWYHGRTVATRYADSAVGVQSDSFGSHEPLTTQTQPR
jgi:hypothetical protein